MASTATSSPAVPPHNLTSYPAASSSPSFDVTPAAAAPPPRHDILADFNYYKDPGDGSPPAPSYVGKPETYERPAETLKLLVRDIRGEEGKYSLDGQGFQVHQHVSREKAFVDDEEIRKVYYPEVEEILKSVTGASKIFIFDHTIRRTAQDQRVAPHPSEDGSQQPPAAISAPSLRGPVQRVHIDQSYKAAPNRVTHHLPHEAPLLLRGRYQIINVWRPIKPIRKDPLGVADANSVPDGDLLPVQLIYPDRVGETFTVRPNKAHRWFYLREQTPEEVLLIKCFDSKRDGRARRVPHSAFVDEGAAGEEPRESIEVRTLVFHPDDTE